MFSNKREFLKEYKLFAEGNPYSYYPQLKCFTQMNRQEPVVIRSASSEKKKTLHTRLLVDDITKLSSDVMKTKSVVVLPLTTLFY